MILFGALYGVVGVGFAAPSHHVREWRLAAWLVSAAGFAAHIAYEHFRVRHSPRSGARHVALAVGFGAFGLAVAANIHARSIASTDQHRQLLLLALGLWPVMTVLPAFLVALAVGGVLARLRKAAPAKVRSAL